MCSSASQLNEGEETFLKDVEDGGEEEGQSQEDEQLVCQLPPVVLQDQFPPQVDGSCHAFKLLVGFLHRPGGGGCVSVRRKRNIKGKRCVRKS